MDGQHTLVLRTSPNKFDCGSFKSFEWLTLVTDEASYSKIDFDRVTIPTCTFRAIRTDAEVVIDCLSVSEEALDREEANPDHAHMRGWLADIQAAGIIIISFDCGYYPTRDA